MRFIESVEIVKVSEISKIVEKFWFIEIVEIVGLFLCTFVRRVWKKGLDFS